MRIAYFVTDKTRTEASRDRAERKERGAHRRLYVGVSRERGLHLKVNADDVTLAIHRPAQLMNSDTTHHTTAADSTLIIVYIMAAAAAAAASSVQASLPCFSVL